MLFIREIKRKEILTCQLQCAPKMPRRIVLLVQELSIFSNIQQVDRDLLLADEFDIRQPS